MKILPGIHVNNSIDQLASATSQLIGHIDNRIKTGYQAIAHYILSPQSIAGYTGLKKLVEKDYHHDNEDLAGSLVSS